MATLPDNFRVDGSGGGDWHVDVAPAGTASGEGAPEAPRLSLRFRTTDEFCRMLTVRLNVPLALVTKSCAATSACSDV